MPTCRYRHLTSPDKAPLHDLEVVRITPVSPPRHVPVIPTLDSIGFTASNPKARTSVFLRMKLPKTAKSQDLPATRRRMRFGRGLLEQLRAFAARCASAFDLLKRFRGAQE